MKISVLLFATLREAAGADRVEMELPEGATPRRLAETLAESYPKLRPHLQAMAFAIDGEFVAADMVLRSAEELALLPPVSGGGQYSVISVQ
ncbi:MAG: MoaD/ThiS family protein [bacterium]